MTLILPALIVQRFESWFYFSSIGLIFSQDVSSFFSSKDWIVLASYIYPWILNILSCTHFLVHWSNGYALSLFLCFRNKESIKTLHSCIQRFYSSKDVISLCPEILFILGFYPFLWISFDENFNNMRIGNSHHLTYIRNSNHIYKTSSTSFGTCLEADAFRELKHSI